MLGGLISKKLILFFYPYGIVLILFSVFIFGCKKNSSTHIEERDGLLYIQNTNELFTGKVLDTLAKKILEYDVVDGKKNGTFKISSISGALEMLGTIKDNLNEGQWFYYYPNGQIESAGYFSNNLSEGKWTWYFENGKLKEVGYFKGGKKDGSWTIYDEKGNIKQKIFFKDDQVIFSQEFGKDLFS